MYYGMIILLIVLFYVLLIRPQRKREKADQAMRNSIMTGDRICTIGGIYGTVVELKDKSVLIEVDKDVKIRVDRNALQGDFSESEAAQK